MERENYCSAKHIATQTNKAHESWCFGKNRCGARLYTTNEMCTMTSLLNEKFHHIVGCESMRATHSKASIQFQYTYIHIFMCIGDERHTFRFGERVGTMVRFEHFERCSRSCLEREQHAAFFSLLIVLFLCNRCSVLLIIAWHECVYSEAETRC